MTNEFVHNIKELIEEKASVLLQEKLSKMHPADIAELCDELSEEEASVVAHFKSPARPNIAASADAATKIAGVRSGFAETDVFLEMLGFDQADIRRIKAQEQRARGMAVLEELSFETE